MTSGSYSATGPLPSGGYMRRIVRHLRKLGFVDFELHWQDPRYTPAGEARGYLISFGGAAPVSMGTSCAAAMDWIDERKRAQEAP